jgi:hypothetical protein
VPNGPALFSLRPENVRVSTKTTSNNVVRAPARVLQQAFHGATELIRAQCADGLVLVMRTASGDLSQEEVCLEFNVADAIPVRESPERN